MTDERPADRPKRRWLWWPVAAAVVAFAVAAWRVWPEGPTPGSGRANLIMISIDTLRADHLGCYGYSRPTSPAIDRLAEQGVRFKTVIAQSPWTLPSHVSMLTGLYPHRHGVTTSRHKLSGEVPTLARALAGAGYVTGAYINSHWLTKEYGLDSGFDHFERVSEWDGAKLVNRGPEITDKAIQWIKDNETKPFFLFVHYFDVHSDYQPDDAYRKAFVDPTYSGNIDGSTGQLLQVRKGLYALTDSDVKHLVDLYDAEIRQLDEQIGRFMRFLEQRGRAKDTYVILTADHGEEFMEHGGVLHARTMYEEVVAVPLLFRGPGIPAGVVVPTLTQVVDIAPTALALLGVTCDFATDGTDLRNNWISPDRVNTDRIAYAAADRQNTRPDIKRMLRTPRHKLIYNRHSGVRELYDLQKDPGERQNLAITEPEAADTLMQLMRKLMAGGREAEHIAPPTTQTIEQLKGLGYL